MGAILIHIHNLPVRKDTVYIYIYTCRTLFVSALLQVTSQQKGHRGHDPTEFTDLRPGRRTNLRSTRTRR